MFIDCFHTKLLIKKYLRTLLIFLLTYCVLCDTSRPFTNNTKQQNIMKILKVLSYENIDFHRNEFHVQF